MQTNIYALDELSNTGEYVNQPIILTVEDMTVSGIFIGTHVQGFDPEFPESIERAEVWIGDRPTSDVDWVQTRLLKILVTQDDLSSGLISISAHRKAPLIDTKALIYVHKAHTELSETQLSIPHTYSHLIERWIPITGTHKIPLKSVEIADFEVINFPQRKKTPAPAESAESTESIESAEPKQVGMPKDHPFPAVWKLGEKLGIKIYDNGTVNIAGKVLTNDEVLVQATSGTTPVSLMSFGNTLEDYLSKKA